MDVWNTCHRDVKHSIGLLDELLSTPCCGAYLNATHELCEGIKDFLISASISYTIDPISGACFVQYIMVIMMAYWTASVLHVQKERDE